MTKLGEICKIESGGTPSRANNSYWNGGTIPWIKISDMKGMYVESCDEFITKEGLCNSSAKIFSKGTVLISIFATLGEVSILNFQATTNQAIAGLHIIDDKVNLNYLYYYLKSLRPKIERIARGVAQNNINLSILRNIDITIPDKRIQEKIVMKMDIVDKLINDFSKYLKDLDTLVKSQYYRVPLPRMEVAA